MRARSGQRSGTNEKQRADTSPCSSSARSTPTTCRASPGRERASPTGGRGETRRGNIHRHPHGARDVVRSPKGNEEPGASGSTRERVYTPVSVGPEGCILYSVQMPGGAILRSDAFCEATTEQAPTGDDEHRQVHRACTHRERSRSTRLGRTRHALDAGASSAGHAPTRPASGPRKKPARVALAGATPFADVVHSTASRGSLPPRTRVDTFIIAQPGRALLRAVPANGEACVNRPA